MVKRLSSSIHRTAWIRKIKTIPALPFLVSIYGVVALYAENISETPVGVIWRPLLVLTLSAAALLILFRVITKDWQKSGLILGFLLLLFVTYGHVYIFIKDVLLWRDVTVSGVYIFRHQTMSKVWFLTAVVGFVLIFRMKNLRPIMQYATAMSAILLLFPVYTIGSYLVQESNYDTTPETTDATLRLPAENRAPDIYFIVLDAYGRSDVLQNVFGLDNSEFINDLEDMGFYVVECSQSNYARTKLSVASTLNLDYIQNLAPDLNAEDVDFWVKPYLLESKVRTQLETLGYKTVAFYNGFPVLEWKNADYYLNTGERNAIKFRISATVTPFEELFLNTTLFRAFIDLRLAGAEVSSDPTRREVILYTLETLPQIPNISGAKFVYAHLILPHPPFVFGPNGEETANSEKGLNDITLYEDEAMRAAFRDQTLYTNQRLIPILRSIIEESSVPPIIVLESDHGPTAYGGAQNRMANFMAYYLPGTDPAEIFYPSITPVNTFRVVFNTYFGAEYPLLEDVSYYSESTTDLEYEVIPNTCAGQ
ncbi:MAG: hypothetical protein AB1607_16340 [Chloroflexota bacterium]